MKVKTILKAAASAAMGALMLGATLSGAATAATLGDFPVPFVENGQMNSIMVVGSQGTDTAGIASDIAGAIEVAAALGQATVKMTSATGAGGSVSVETSGGSGVTKSVWLGQALTQLGSESQFKETLKHDDLPTLKDTSAGAAAISGEDGSSVDYHEELSLDGTFTTATSSHADTGTQLNRVRQYKGDVGLDVGSSSTRYLLVFDDSLDKNGDLALTCPGGTLGDEGLYPMKNILFLGNEMEIKCSTFATSMVVSLGQKITLTQGQTVTYGDYQITLVGLDTLEGRKASITVSKGGTTQTILVEELKTKNVFSGALSIKVDITFPGAAGAVAQIIVGQNLDQTVSSGSTKFMNLDDWEWIVTDRSTASANFKPIIGVQYVGDSLTGDDMLSEGDKLDLPGGEISVVNQGLVVSNLGTLEVRSASGDVYDLTTGGKVSKPYIQLRFKKGDGTETDAFTVSTDNSSIEAGTNLASAKEVRLYFVTPAEIHVSFVDSAGTMKTGSRYVNVPVTNLTSLRYDTTLIYFSFTNATLTATSAEQNMGNLTVMVRDPQQPGTTRIDQLNVKIETTTGAATAQIANDATGTLEYQYLGGTGSEVEWTSVSDYSNNEDGYYTAWGLWEQSPKSDVESRTIKLKVPNDRQKLKVLVGSATGAATVDLGQGDTIPGTTAKIKSINAAGAQSAQIVPISVPIAKTDSEVSDTEKTTVNMLLFGGPSVNMLVKQLNLQASEFKDANGNAIGKIKMVSGAFGGSKTAVVVAGWDAANTRMASYVLAHYKDYSSKFSGKNEVTVSGTTTSTLSVA